MEQTETELAFACCLQKSPTKGEGCGNDRGSEIVPRGGGPRKTAARVGPEDAGRSTAWFGLQRVAGLSHPRTIRSY